MFCLLNFGLSQNLQEEVAALLMAQKVGGDKLAWLLPIYPDEVLPFDEVDKLKGLKLGGNVPGLAALERATQPLAALTPAGMAASNNWAIAGSNTRSGKPILANDTHLPLSMPSYWNFMQIRAPKFQAAGVTIAGVPAVVAGFNGKLGWGMTMVMGDNQDLYLEQVRREGSRLMYLADGNGCRPASATRPTSSRARGRSARPFSKLATARCSTAYSASASTRCNRCSSVVATAWP